MNDELAQKAIKSALDGKWKDAIKFNKEILKTDKNDVDALNRLARALCESGKIKKAKLISKKVIKIDPFNKIACKCLEKWSNLKEGLNSKAQGGYSHRLFIEEPGKTKIACLINLSSQNIISTLNCADKVGLNLQGHRVSITSPDGKYIGRLPDDLGQRIKTLTSKGNEYEVLIKSITSSSVSVFIKEIKTSLELGDTVSFPSEKVQYTSYTRPDLIQEQDEVFEEIIEET